MAQGDPLGLFEGFGIELEYMLVDRESLDVRPIADQLLRHEAKEQVGDFVTGQLGWSNELVLHVIELKTNGPAPQLEGLAALFQQDIDRINRTLALWDARLLPTAMHPWMDPHREKRLWPHDNGEIYAAFDRIFDCSGHGWANLQSMHLNLPFAGDEQFGRLHAAIRLALPLFPALAASSPLADGGITGLLDTRLSVYRTNCRRIPSLTGMVVPEPIYTPRAYREELLARLYADIAPHDPQGLLQEEWLNARGAIARFDRDAIEIRVLDVQECPQADLAIAQAIVAVLQALVEEQWIPWAAQKQWPTEPLADLLILTTKDAERTVIDDRRYLDAFAYPERGRCRASELWQHLIEAVLPPLLADLPAPPRSTRRPAAVRTGGRRGAVTTHPSGTPAADADAGASAATVPSPLGVILREGCLARRILAALTRDGSRQQLRAVYDQLADCLAQGRMFRAGN